MSRLPPPSASRVSLREIDVDKLSALHQRYPFIHQIDVIVPSSHPSISALSSLKATYWRGPLQLGWFFQSGLLQQCATTGRIHALSFGTLGGEDVWCVDRRGVLRLQVTPDTYHRLSVVGEPVPSRRMPSSYVIDIDLKDSKSHAWRHSKESLVSWEAAHGPWEGVICLSGDEGLEGLPKELQRQDMLADHCILEGVKVPDVASNLQGLEEHLELWQEQAFQLYEWAAMAVLSCDRLSATDTVDPFISLYSPPEPFNNQDLTRLQWMGLADPSMVEQILSCLSSSVSGELGPVIVILNSFLDTPTSYLPAAEKTVPPRRVGLDQGRTCCSLIRRESRPWIAMESTEGGGGR